MLRPNYLHLFFSQEPALRAYIRQRVSNASDSDDIFQELSLLVVRSIDSCEFTNFIGWCYGAAYHLIGQSLRRARRELAMPDLETTALRTPSHDGEGAAIARLDCHRMTKKLQASDMDLLYERYWLGEQPKELATRRGKSSASLRMQLLRLRMTLAGSLA